jgi:hypothetical protein
VELASAVYLLETRTRKLTWRPSAEWGYGSLSGCLVGGGDLEMRCCNMDK